MALGPHVLVGFIVEEIELMGVTHTPLGSAPTPGIQWRYHYRDPLNPTSGVQISPWYFASMKHSAEQVILFQRYLAGKGGHGQTVQ